MPNVATEELKNLSPQEREYTLKILEELQKNGNSKLYEELVYADYKEIPTDIVTFIKDNQYLGKAWHLPDGKCKLFPYWENKLKELFPDNTHTNFNTFIESGARGLGKAQPLDSPVLTDSGFVRMGDLKVGDKVIGVDGNPYPISHVFPQGSMPVYKVLFEDGSFTECCGDHLWEVTNEMTGETSVKDLVTIVRSEITFPHSSKYKYTIPMCSPVNINHTDTGISPYVLGVLIESGAICHDNTVMVVFLDDDVVKNYIEKELKKDGYRLKKSIRYGNYEIVNSNGSSNKYIDYILSNNITLISSEKNIPLAMKNNDIETRNAILNGILDINGTVNNLTGVVELVTLSKQYCDDVSWLVRSLGGMCYIDVKMTPSIGSRDREISKGHESYILYIKLPKEVSPFKNSEFTVYTPLQENARKRLVGVYPVEDKECQCILVDYDRHLYITDDFIVTHNSELAVTIGLYLMHRLMCLKNPYLTLNLKPTEQVAFAFMNITKKLAEEIGVTKFQNTVQMSPWFMSRGTMTGRTDMVWNPPEFINIIIGSQASDVIGQAVYYAFFDEISFIKNMDVEVQKTKALDMIDTAIGGMKTRFTNKGKNPTLLILASSKRSEKSFLEEHIKKKAATDQLGTLIVDEPVWNVRPASEYSGKRFYVALGNRFLNSEVLPNDIADVELAIWRSKGYKILSVPIEYLANFKEDIDRALCDFAGISSSELTTYISGARLMDCINEDYKNPFTKEVIEVGNSKTDIVQYSDFFDLNNVPSELKSRPLYVHMDMSVSGDKTGIAGTWITHKKHSDSDQQDGRELYYRLAFAVSVKAPKGQQIAFEKNRQFIYWLKKNGFNVKGITTDTYQSADTGQSLLDKGYDYEILSVDRVGPDKICKPYQYLKSTIYERRVEMFKDNLLIEEIIGLERNNGTGKVDHSPLGVNSKDKADAVCGSIFSASQHGEEFAYDFGEDLTTIQDISGGIVNDAKVRAQVNIDFEQEMQKLMDPLRCGVGLNQNAINGVPASVYLQDGIIAW